MNRRRPTLSDESRRAGSRLLADERAGSVRPESGRAACSPLRRGYGPKLGGAARGTRPDEGDVRPGGSRGPEGPEKRDLSRLSKAERRKLARRRAARAAAGAVLGAANADEGGSDVEDDASSSIERRGAEAASGARERLARRRAASKGAGGAGKAAGANRSGATGPAEGRTDGGPRHDGKRAAGRPGASARASEPAGPARRAGRGGGGADRTDLARASMRRRATQKAAARGGALPGAQTLPGPTGAASRIARATRGLKGGNAAFAASGGGAMAAVVAVVAVVAITFGAAVGASGSAFGGDSWGFEGLSAHERQIAVYLRSKGLDKLHAAAIMGNLKQESGCDPAATQVPGKAGGGIGICQWGYGVDGGRGNEMERWAESRGLEWDSLSAQLDWLWAEMTDEGPASGQTSWYNPFTSPVRFETFVGLRSLAEATAYWERWIEAAGNPMLDARVAYAREYLAIFRAGGSGSEAEAVIEEAYSHIGAPYVFGAAGPDEFDCSGFVKWCFEAAGYDLGAARTADQLYRISTPVDEEEAMPGDIVVFTYGSPQAGETYGHIGIYLGDGMMIDTASPPTGVKVGPVGAGATFGRL